MSEESSELIVQKGHSFPNNVDLGNLNILFVSLDNGNYFKAPSLEEFPTKSIFISKDFKIIDEQFKTGQLLRLLSWKESREDFKEGDHKHWALGNKVKPIEPSAFIPIYDGSIPDIPTGHVDIQNLPVNEPFFIKDSLDIYGPFTASLIQEDNKQKVSPYHTLILKNDPYSILKIKYNILEKEKIITPSIENSPYRYIISFRLLSKISKEDKIEIDFISDENLISLLSKSKIGKKTILSKKEAEKLKNGLVDASKKSPIKKTSRVDRFEKIIDQYLTETDIGEEIINNFFKDKKGQDFLNQYIEKKPELVNSANKIKQEIEIQEEELHKLKRQVKIQKESVDEERKTSSEQITKEKEKAKIEIEEIKKKSKQDIEKEQQEVMGKLLSKIIDEENKLKKLDTEIKDFYKIAEDIKDHDSLKDEVHFLKKSEEKLTRAVEQQSKLLSSQNLGEKITEVKTVIDILQGRSLNKNNDAYEFKAPEITKNIPDQAKKYIQTLVEYFEKDEHTISFEEITNLLITIQQSFLTVLSGLPGSGKTSSIMRLSSAHGLCPKNESKSDCFLNIPVARGWVSSRDFVGFNNSLKGIFQPAKTGVYQFLRQSEQEESQHFLRMILLDEANLSPIEHYWSEFLAMCDKEGRNRPLDTGIQGKQRYLKVAENIRFIATINNDNTTELLSPRLCDRAPIITMDNFFITSTSEDIASLALDGVISYEQLEKWFGLPSEEEDSTSLIIDNFIEKMKEIDLTLGTEIYVSRRKINAIAAYYQVANRYIDDNTLVIDFSISQYLLPLINGYGDNFKRRLEGLEEYAKVYNLKRTVILLKKILNSGEMYTDSYSFF